MSYKPCYDCGELTEWLERKDVIIVRRFLFNKYVEVCKSCLDKRIAASKKVNV